MDFKYLYDKYKKAFIYRNNKIKSGSNTCLNDDKWNNELQNWKKVSFLLMI